MEQALAVSNNDAEMNVHVLQTTKLSIQISYHFKNKTSSDIYLFNKIYHDFPKDGLTDFDKNITYNIVGSDGVLITKSMIDVPKNIKVEYKVYPCTTKVLPQGEFSETFKINLPLTLFEPYGRRVSKPDTKDLPIWFSIGYFVGVPEAEKMAIMTKTPSGNFHYFDPFAFQDQKILQVGPFDNKMTTYLVE